MSLDLDDRQRAMLAEMGVRVWWPQTEPERDAPTLAESPPAYLSADSDLHDELESIADDAHPAWAEAQFDAESAMPVQAPSSAEHPPERVRTLPSHPLPVAAVARVTTLAPLPTGIEAMDWSALQAAVAGCQACAMCLGRRMPVLAAPARANWLVLGEPPDDAQERAGAPFVDDAGRLLDNMLRAVHVTRCSTPEAAQGAGAALPDPAHSAYLSLVLKCRPAVPTAPDAAALQLCAHYLRREIALVQPRVILAMGRLAMQLLLSEDHPQGLKLPLGKLRGQVWHYQGVPVVVTYPPVYLLRNGQDKARAWDDLCLAADVVEGKGNPI